ncbi:MAG: TIGR02281 family clan AA aspartic protease [Rickettsiales bacterium]|nr:TIGR02281 family clan AA aspartic protease [Rickettsiales bacterium]
MIANIFVLVVLFSGLFLRVPSTQRWEKIKQILIWVFVIYLIAVVYNNRNLFDFNIVPYRMRTEEGKIEISKTDDGHFHIMLKVNEKNVLFLIDTGATTTTLSLKDAERIGIDTSKLSYQNPINTASGSSFAASLKLDNFKLNDFQIDNFWVYVNKEGDTSLLGMNFLNKLKGYEVRQDKMILYY